VRSLVAQPLRVGLLGAGYIADWHVKALRTVRNVQVVAVADANRGRATTFAQRYGIPGQGASIADLVAQKCDAVHVLLPPDLHYAAAAELLDSGCHVLLEKPACTRVEDCLTLADKATKAGRRVGVSHNFLFSPVYEQLQADVASGRLGPLSEVSIVWNKEFGQVRGGPFGGWVFRDPGNILLEVGPHSVAHLLDLIGDPEKLQVDADRVVPLPNGQPFFRRWNIRTRRGLVAADLTYGLDEGFTEHRIHVRGPIGTATADFEAGTYVLRRHAPLPDDFDRWQITKSEGRGLLRQGRRKVRDYVLSKFKLSKRGNAFGTSLAKSIGAFYETLNGAIDPRLSIDFATRVVTTCSRIAAAGPTAAARSDPRPTPTRTPEVLVLGGTGFIGQAVIRQLVAEGRSVRLLARDPRHLPLSLQELPLDVVRGDLDNVEQLARAMEGTPTVIHLARAHVKTWNEFVEREIGGTRRVAEACLQTGVKRLLYTGTIDSYFAGEEARLGDDAPLDPKIQRRNLYARAKAESEVLLQQMRTEKGLPLAIFRPGIVIGRGGSPFHWGVGMWTANSVCRLWGKGENSLPLVLVDDVARALATAVAAEGVIGETFNLVGDPMLNAREYLAELERATGRKLDIRPTSIFTYYRNDMFKWFVKTLVRHPERRFPSYRDWQSRSQKAIIESEKAKRILGWKPCAERSVLVDEGIAKAAREWLA